MAILFMSTSEGICALFYFLNVYICFFFLSFCLLSCSFFKVTMVETIATESYGGYRKRCYQRDPDGTIQLDASSSSRLHLWDHLRAFCSGVSGSIALQGVLKEAGVGDSSASIAATTATWLLRNGVGMLGQIGFAWMKGLAADVTNDFAIALEATIPLISPLPVLSTILFCFASLAKAMVGVAGAATRAALTLHQARRDNMADVAAKDGSQETLVNLFSLIISMLLTNLITNNTRISLLLLVLLSCVHLYANKCAVCCLVMPSLNQARLRLLLEHFLDTRSVASPSAINSKEPVWPPWTSGIEICLGAPLCEVISSITDLQRARGALNPHYLIAPPALGKVRVVLHPQASAQDIVQASVQAHLLVAHCERTRSVDRQKEGWQLVEQSGSEARAIWSDLSHGLEFQGWRLGASLLHADEWRAQWDTKLIGTADKAE
uniref:Zgc:162613 n=1 Tax=Eptatretus burgeri TaxID=7764 RepID=A0A8C4NKS6_EPTBU